MHNRSKENRNVSRKSYFHEVFIISNEMQISPHLHHDCAFSLSSRLFHCIPLQTHRNPRLCLMHVCWKTPLWRRGAQSRMRINRATTPKAWLMNINDVTGRSRNGPT